MTKEPFFGGVPQSLDLSLNIEYFFVKIIEYFFVKKKDEAFTNCHMKALIQKIGYL